MGKGKFTPSILMQKHTCGVILVEGIIRNRDSEYKDCGNFTMFASIVKGENIRLFMASFQIDQKEKVKNCNSEKTRK